jgi:hypothetical protein
MILNSCDKRPSQGWSANAAASPLTSLPRIFRVRDQGVSFVMLVLRRRGLFLAILVAFTSKGIWPQIADTVLPPALTTEQIVEQMQRHNREQTEGLIHYQSVRHYQVEYRGFSTRAAAKMDVEINYDASSGKSFRIVTESGSKALCEKVLKRAVDSERDAQRNEKSTALTMENYRFQLAGNESLAGRPAYILAVEPRTKSKFLYRGKIWVDAVDFALVKVEAEPAKNPSFWIGRTHIRESYAKRGSFWLPEHNWSETKVRIGGTAVFVIDYGTYQIVANAS